MSNLKPITRSHLPTHIVQAPSNTLSKEARKAVGKYVERKKQEGEVEAPKINIWKRTEYRTGDGDHTAQVPRAGSMDAYSLPSRGNRT